MANFLTRLAHRATGADTIVQPVIPLAFPAMSKPIRPDSESIAAPTRSVDTGHDFRSVGSVHEPSYPQIKDTPTPSDSGLGRTRRETHVEQLSANPVRQDNIQPLANPVEPRPAVEPARWREPLENIIEGVAPIHVSTPTPLPVVPSVPSTPEPMPTGPVHYTVVSTVIEPRRVIADVVPHEEYNEAIARVQPMAKDDEFVSTLRPDVVQPRYREVTPSQQFESFAAAVQSEVGRREHLGMQQAPAIRISIGRVEVRAIMPPTAPPPRRAAPKPSGGNTLEEYLNKGKSR